jgi:hypothetical protein
MNENIEFEELVERIEKIEERQSQIITWIRDLYDTKMNKSMLHF